MMDSDIYVTSMPPEVLSAALKYYHSLPKETRKIYSRQKVLDQYESAWRGAVKGRYLQMKAEPITIWKNNMTQNID